MWWLRKFTRSSLKVWLTVVVFLLGTIGVLFALAMGRIPGIPDANLKTVPISSSSTQNDELSLYVEPPVSLLEVRGADQLLSLEFTNRSRNPIDILNIGTQEGSCFSLSDVNPHGGPIPAGRSRVLHYHLSLSQMGGTDRCTGRHTFSFSYVYREDGAGKQSASVDREQERAVSTGPLLITTHRKVVAERFFHIAGAIAIPILLAMATFLIQQFQDQKLERGKEQELRLEVWKLIFPMIDGHFRRHYVPIYRRMDVIRDELNPKNAPLDPADLVAEIVVLRAMFERLIVEVGGYYFRSKAGEDVCAELTGALWVTCKKTIDPNHFAQVVASVEPQDSVQQAKAKLVVHGWLQPFEIAWTTPAFLSMLDRLLELSILVMDFENNFLWYPEWYERAPTLDFGKLMSADLGFSAAEQANWQRSLAAYRKDLPRDCVVSKK